LNSPSVKIMPSSFDGNANIPFRSPLHRIGDMIGIRRIDDVLSECIDAATPLSRVTGSIVRQASIVGKNLVVDGLWLLRVPSAVRPIFVRGVTRND
jgi:hypothetical protein